MVVCTTCGVAIGLSGDGSCWWHLDGYPEDVPNHDAEPVEESVYQKKQEAFTDTRILVEELIRHHTTFHPMSDCNFSTRVLAALRVQ